MAPPAPGVLSFDFAAAGGTPARPLRALSRVVTARLQVEPTAYSRERADAIQSGRYYLGAARTFAATAAELVSLPAAVEMPAPPPAGLGAALEALDRQTIEARRSSSSTARGAAPAPSTARRPTSTIGSASCSKG